MTDNTKSLFQVGTPVALIHSNSSGSSVTRWIVSKVRKDGRFYISFREPDGGERQSDTIWTPESFDNWRARCAKRSSYSTTWLEVWSHKHDDAVEEQRVIAAAYVDKDDIIAWLKNLDVKNPIDRDILMRLKRSWVGQT